MLFVPQFLASINPMSDRKYNPSLSQEPRYEPAAVIPIKEDTSLVDWLKATNRLIPREVVAEEEKSSEDVDLADFIDTDDPAYEDNDDSDMDVEDNE
ncbi:MAG: DUF3134 domain-containing protein [Microcystaceae cyanobacterium]